MSPEHREATATYGSAAISTAPPAMPVTRRIALCADDFGRTETACRSIVELAEIGAISSTSCMVDAPWSGRYAAALKPGRRFAVGLHLNLTEGEASYRRVTVKRLIVQSYAFAIRDRSALRAEIRRQIECFTQLFGRAPDFVDGHEHAHQLPVIRELLLEELTGRYGHDMAVRSTVPRCHRGVKAAVIGMLGARPFTAAAVARGFTVNRDFGGVYDFTERVPFERRLAGWLASLPDRGLIMCHPEAPPASPVDRARVAEHRFLASSAWKELRARMQVALVPFTCAAFAEAPEWAVAAPTATFPLST